VMSRTISWFSCGAASACASKLALRDYDNVIIARCIVDNEHEDNSRFADDISDWLDADIVNLRSDKYVDCWDVWEKTRWLNGPQGARCTVEMKKKVRQRFSEIDDIHIIGFTYEEEHRAIKFNKENPEIATAYPLIDNKISKSMCFDIIRDVGIELPAMYRLGYYNANCIGCVKGGAGYWNKIRVDFRDDFYRMADLEKDIGASCINGRPLATLPPAAGRHKDLYLPDCGLFCGENEGWGKHEPH